MKKIIITFLLLLICPCIVASQQTVNQSVLPSQEAPKPLFGKLLSDVNISKTSFNPTLGEEIAVSCNLSKSAGVTVDVYDSDHGLIKRIANEKLTDSGKQIFIWDGKDTDGHIVPDEAYFFTVAAEDKSGIKEIYDPTAFSGGAEHDIAGAEIDPQSYTVNYKMPEMGRVMIRIGIQGGPLMNQLVDWEPRVKGLITEYWNGKDKDNLADIYHHSKFKMIIVYFTLPEHSVIAFGNNSTTYRNYKKNIASQRPVKENRTRTDLRMSMHYTLPRTADYSPTLKMDFSNIQEKDSGGIPVLKEKTLVKVYLDEQDSAVFQNHQYEICFFLDYEFYVEDEVGYTPFNWVWDLSNVKEGEHLLTVNVSGFKDQIGILSRKVKVVR